MSDAKSIADKYIAQDGGPPEKAKPVAAMASEAAERIACLAFFIGAHHPDEMQGGWRAAEAMLALSKLCGIPVDKLRRVAGWEK